MSYSTPSRWPARSRWSPAPTAASAGPWPDAGRGGQRRRTPGPGPRGLAPAIAELEALGVTADAGESRRHPAAASPAGRRRDHRPTRPIDVLVNNAGSCIHRPALEVTPAEWRFVMDVNVNGVWNCAQAFGRQMVAQRSGAIVNIGSISAQIVNRPQWQPGVQRLQGGGAPADQVLGGGVGPVRRTGQRARPRLHQDRDGAGRRAAVSPAVDRGRADAAYAMPAELGPSVVFLASDASSFMTG